MTNRNHKKLIATLPKLKLVITRLTEIMEEEHDLLEHQPETFELEELELVKGNINTLDENIGALNGILETINQSFEIS